MGGDGAKTFGVKVSLQLQRCMSHYNKYQRALGVAHWESI